MRKNCYHLFDAFGYKAKGICNKQELIKVLRENELKAIKYISDGLVGVGQGD